MKGKKKVILFVSILVFIFIILLLFIKMNYKNKNFGNNMTNKSIQGIEEYILSISSYEAKVEVKIESNKNSNKYLMSQIHEKGKVSKQTVLEPSNISGLEIKHENNTLTITNSQLNLVTVYENYSYLVENCLWLDSFIKDYEENKAKNQTAVSEENGIVTMETRTRNENNKYIYYKKLIIDKTTGKPTKLLVQDMNKKNLIYILYNEITINGVI